MYMFSVVIMRMCYGFWIYVLCLECNNSFFLEIFLQKGYESYIVGDCDDIFYEECNPDHRFVLGYLNRFVTGVIGFCFF